MNNEIGRKITSLTIMTIMIAGGMTIAAPGMMPSAAAENQLLFVSAENATFGNTFSQGQIVEIIVQDPALSDTEVAEAEPTVEVNGDTVRMTQGADGYWYAYIADTAGLVLAEASSAEVDYGTAVGKGDGLTNASSVVVTVDSDATVYYTAAFIGGEPTMSNYAGDAGTSKGQIGLTNAHWPFIQTFDFSAGATEVVLEKAGNDESVMLDYDNQGDFASIALDRMSAPVGSELHLTITDGQLNLDPTADDIALFYTLAGSEGVSIGSKTTYDNIALNCDDNCVLKITKNTNSAAVAVLANDVTLDDVTANDYMVFLETGANTGIFVNTDDADDANLVVNTTAARATTATIDYNDSAVSFSVSTAGGSIDMDESSVGDEWNSGESMTVTLTDADLNTNTAAKDNITVLSAKLPTIVVGSPLSAGTDISRTLTVTATEGTNFTSNTASNEVEVGTMIIPIPL